MANETTYSGVDIFLHAPINKFDQTYNHPYDLTQWIGKGLAYTWYPQGQTEMGGRYDYIFGTNRAYPSRYYISEILSFFDTMKGRWGAFFVPTWNKDIVINTTFSGTDTTLYIDDIEYDDFYGSETIMGRYIVIWFSETSWVIRRIVSSSSNSIVLDQSPETTVSQADLGKLYISFLVYSRFDQDEITFDYITENIARLSLSFAGLVGETI
jgi:hypothetical protein